MFLESLKNVKRIRRKRPTEKGMGRLSETRLVEQMLLSLKHSFPF